MSKHDKYIDKLIDTAENNLEKHIEQLEKQLTKTLQKKYKGKKVECKCFDEWTDGDDYYFNDILLDIQAYKHFKENSFYVNVTFKFKGCSWDKDEKPRPVTFHLESIEKVK